MVLALSEDNPIPWPWMGPKRISEARLHEVIITPEPIWYLHSMLYILTATQLLSGHGKLCGLSDTVPLCADLQRGHRLAYRLPRTQEVLHQLPGRWVWQCHPGYHQQSRISRTGPGVGQEHERARLFPTSHCAGHCRPSAPTHTFNRQAAAAACLPTGCALCFSWMGSFPHESRQRRRFFPSTLILVLVGVVFFSVCMGALWCVAKSQDMCYGVLLHCVVGFDSAQPHCEGLGSPWLVHSFHAWPHAQVAISWGNELSVQGVPWEFLACAKRPFVAWLCKELHVFGDINLGPPAQSLSSSNTQHLQLGRLPRSTL